jgi:hypothetical protein
MITSVARPVIENDRASVITARIAFQSVRRRAERADRCCDVGDRPKQDQRIIFRRNKSASGPKACRLDVNGVDDQRPSAHEIRGCHTALQCMLEQPSTNSLADPILICRELSQQQARYRIGRLAGADRSRQCGRQDGRGGETIIANDPIDFMNDKDGRKTLLLVGERSRLQPSIKRRFATGKFGDFVGSCKWFGAGKCHLSLPSFCILGFPGGRALQQFDQFGHRAGGLR